MTRSIGGCLCNDIVDLAKLDPEMPLVALGLVEASIGRMVPVQTEEMKAGEPMRVCAERYGFLPTDKDAFKGGVPEIQNMVPFAPFD